MNRLTPSMIAASSLTLALLFPAEARASQPPPRDVAVDVRLETQIWTTYALNPNLRANDLRVSVLEGKATLTGNVEEGVSKELAGQIALGVAGIKDVDNRIVVKPDYVPAAPSSDRSFGETVDDATITATVKSKLIWSSYTDGLSIKVDTHRGKVTLHGAADSAAAKDLATRLAQNTRGVGSVDNQLVISGPGPGIASEAKSVMHEASVEVSDLWITAKVKSTLIYTRNVDGYSISVTTRAGVVTLTGKVGSGTERELAIDLAKNVRGVKSVQSGGLTL